MSQAGIVDIEGSHPQIPTLFVCNVGSAIPIANTLEILGEAVAAHGVPLETVGSGNIVEIEVQYASAAASSVAANAGVCSFDSSEFSVDANGYVTLAGSVSITFDGDSGSATPSAGIINFKAQSTAGHTVTFTAAGSTVTLNTTDINSNTTIGLSSGQNLNGSSSDNTAVGASNQILVTSGQGNTSIGSGCLQAVTTQNANTAVGDRALQHLAGQSNTAIGYMSLNSATSGVNCAVGYISLTHLLTGTGNAVFGTSAGQNYTGSESNNILIFNNGVNGESNTIHIGTQGSGANQQNTCFVAGIVGNTVSNQEIVTINSSTGQLGVTPGFGTMNWSLISANQTLAVANGYICSGGGTLSLALPATSAFGDIIEVVLSGSTGFTITQGAGQQISLGNTSTTAGVGGSLSSTQQGDSIRIVCKTANLTWLILSGMGNPTIV